MWSKNIQGTKHPRKLTTCYPSAVLWFSGGQACIERVANKGFGTCEPWFFDYVSCVDKCVSAEKDENVQVRFLPVSCKSGRRRFALHGQRLSGCTEVAFL